MKKYIVVAKGVQAMRLRGLTIFCAGLFAFLVIIGCGGGGDDGGNTGSSLVDLGGAGQLTTNDPQFPDGSNCDLRNFKPDHDCLIWIGMQGATSNPVSDPFVIVYRKNPLDHGFDNVDALVTYDDDSGGDLDALASFYANAGTRYYAVFTSYNAGDLGTYRWFIAEEEAIAQQTVSCEHDDKPSTLTTVKKKLRDLN